MEIQSERVTYCMGSSAASPEASRCDQNRIMTRSRIKPGLWQWVSIMSTGKLSCVCLRSLSLTQLSPSQWGRRSRTYPRLPVSVPLPSQASVGLTLVGSRQPWQHPDTILWFMGTLWECRGDDHSDLTPAVLSASHQEVENTQTYCSLTHLQ